MKVHNCRTLFHWKHFKIGLVLTSLLCSIPGLSKNSFSQGIDDVKLTIRLGSRSLVDVFSEIENKTEYRFTYRSKIITQTKLPDTVMTDQSLGTVLRFISREARLSFKQIGKTISVKAIESADDLSSMLNHETTEAIVDIKISGVVVSKNDRTPLPGVNIIVKNTDTGTTTDSDGKYTMTVPSNATLIFSFIGFATQEIYVGARSVIDVAMIEDTQTLSEIVVTALGISREKKSLGYAIQQVDGQMVSSSKEPNLINALSGKVAGIRVTTSNTLGGSANILIRGTNTLSGTNQPLFVVDGVPVDNSNYNSSNTMVGAGGYDFGNMAADINPQDIESISVLKGASAAALYGSRALYGVILITTKKAAGENAIKVDVNSGVTISKINKNTLPKFQREYGAGYGPYGNSSDGGFYELDIDGNPATMETVPLVADDASWGPRYDPTRMVYQWYALHPESPYYLQPSPWVAPKYGPEYFFRTGNAWNNNIAISASSANTKLRFSYTNEKSIGILPNQQQNQNTLNLSITIKARERWEVSSSVNYISKDMMGRAATGYSKENPMHGMGMFFQSNVDFRKLKELYITPSGKQMTWHWASPTDLRSAYYNNPYWSRYKDYENDGRERVFGNVMVKHKITDWLTINGRASLDFYDFVIESRTAKGGSGIPGYTKVMRNYKERNNELFATIDKSFTSGISITGLAAISNRSEKRESSTLSTAQGLVVDNVYGITNSVSPQIGYGDDYSLKKQRSIYGQVTVGYKDLMFVDLTARNDWSSTLRKGNNSYMYPSVSTTFVFSELPGLADNGMLSFGKVRFNWAHVGNDTSPYNTDQYFSQYPSFVGSNGTNPVFRMPVTLNNPYLKSETKKALEAGFEVNFFQDRLGLDVTIYKHNTINQILAVETSRATGFHNQFINSGNFQNKGLEVILKGTPLQSSDFKWETSLNWAANRNKVVSLVDGDTTFTNYLLGGFFLTSINATVNQPVGTIIGTNYVFNSQGQKIVNPATGKYMMSEPGVIGNVNPQWNAGFYNAVTYKSISLGVLVDVQRGGDVFSLSTAFGRASGLFEETAGLNNKGNPKRDPVGNGGGVLFEGVNPDGTPNTKYTDAEIYGQAWDYASTPAAMYVFDASYVKLREMSLSYSIPSSLLGKLPVKDVKLSITARNLAILYRNSAIRHFDPEVTRGSGNLQGYESGTYPTPRTYGFNLSLKL